MNHIAVIRHNIVAYLLKARTVEPEKQHSSRHQLSKHIPVATNMRATIGVPLEMEFSTSSVQRGYKEDRWGAQVSSVWESVRKRGSCKGASGYYGLSPKG
jgi:hypothetical protein